MLLFVVSPTLWSQLLETKHILIEHYDFLPYLNTHSVPLQSIPIPKCQLSITKNTFYLKHLVETLVRISKELHTEKQAMKTLS